MRHRFIVIMATVLLLGFSVEAWAAPALYGDFLWGTPKHELAKRSGAAPGEGAFANDLLLPEATFAGMPWNVRLEFQNEKLVRVSLMERYSKARMDAVTKQLREDKFEMLSVLMDASSLDLVKVLKTAGPEGVKDAWGKFVSGKNPKRMIYAWFDTSKISKDMKTMAGSLGDLLMIAAAETREAEVVLLRDEKSASPGMLLVDFSFPAMK